MQSRTNLKTLNVGSKTHFVFGHRVPSFTDMHLLFTVTVKKAEEGRENVGKSGSPASVLLSDGPLMG